MAKKPDINVISDGYYSRLTLNTNFENIRDAFENTLSLDGSNPNAMNAALDMNSNDVLNVNSMDVGTLTVDGVVVTTVGELVEDTSMVTKIYSGAGLVSPLTLPKEPINAASLMVFLDGVLQEADTYSVSGTTLTFTDLPDNVSKCTVHIIGEASTVNPFSDITINGNSGTATLDITETSGTTLGRKLINATNNGKAIIVLGNTDLDSEWEIGGGDNLTFKVGTVGSASAAKNNFLEFDSNGYIILDNNSEIRWGTGTPEATITAPIGSMFVRSDGSNDTSVYVKHTGTGNTGWSAIPRYEEGTFTPTIEDATVGGNVGTSATALGYYTRVGRLMTYHIQMTDIDTTGMTAGNTAYIHGFPTVPITLINYGEAHLDSVSNTNETTHLKVFKDQSYACLRQSVDGAAGSDVLVSDLTSGSADIFATVQVIV